MRSGLVSVLGCVLLTACMDDLPTVPIDVARCGDNRVDAPETCDDGNAVNEDACTNACQRAACGDGIVRNDLQFDHDDYESCDDGNAINEDACLSNCSEASCGDGFVRTDIGPDDWGAERCDDGNYDNQDTCSRDCNPDDHGNDFQTATPLFEHQPMPGQIESGDYTDWGDFFVFRADKDGLYTFSTANGAAPSILDTDCELVNDDNRTLGSTIGGAHCRMELAMRSEQVIYLRVDSHESGNYTVFVEGPCGNAVIEDHEECDPASVSEWDAFSCRSDCRIRRTLSLGDDTSCSLDDGNVYCWGSWLHRIPGGLPANEPGNDVDWSTQQEEIRTPCAVRPQPISSGLPITYFTHAGKGVCGHNRSGQPLCWGGDLAHRGYDETLLSRARACGAQVSGDQCFETAVVLPEEDYGSARGLGINAQSQCMVVEGRVMCWGAWLPSAYHGELGRSIDEQASDPQVELKPEAVAGFDANDPPIFIDGHLHTMCALTQGGKVWCWGSNSFGQLGLGQTTGPETCSGGPCSRAPQLVDLPGFMIDVEVGAHAVCSISRSGKLYCWGKATVTVADETDETDETEACSAGPCVTRPYDLLENTVEMSQRISRVAVGDAHTCALGDDGVVTCWGTTRDGRLGIGDEFLEYGVLVEAYPKVLSRLINVTDIAVGARHSCARVRSSRGQADRIYCWGDNRFGQLGNGQIEPNQVLPIRVLGPR